MRMLQVAVIASIGGLLCGYDRSVLGSALLLVAHDLAMSLSALGWIAGVLTLVLLAGTVVGAIVGGVLADRVGRRPAILWTALLFAVGALLSAGAFDFGISDARIFTAFILVDARLIQGIAIGVSSVVIPVYLAEIAPTPVRGMVVLAFVFAISVGTFTATLAPAVFAEMPGTWRGMFGVGAVVAAAWALGMWFQPESPRWLAGEDQLADADRIVRDLHGAAEVDEAAAGLRAIAGAFKRSAYTPLFGAPYLGVPIVVGSGLALLQQITGFNSVTWFVPAIVRRVGLTPASAWAGSIEVAIALLTAITAVLLADRIGRRKLLLVGLALMAVGLVCLTLAAGVGPRFGLGTLAVAAAAVVLSGFGLGLGPMFWLISAEIFPFAYRARGMSLAATTYWALKLLAAIVAPYWSPDVVPGALFALFALVCAAGLVFVHRFVPETKGRSLEDVEHQLSAEAASV